MNEVCINCGKDDPDVPLNEQKRTKNRNWRKENYCSIKCYNNQWGKCFKCKRKESHGNKINVVVKDVMIAMMVPI